MVAAWLRALGVAEDSRIVLYDDSALRKGAEASRGEHYGYMLYCLAFDEWLFGCQCVQLALWTGAGLSKLGPWFKAVPVSMAVRWAAPVS